MARWWLVSANSSCASRDTFQRSATFSAVMPMPNAMARFSSCAKISGLNAILLPIIGTMLMLSVPAAIITSASPSRMRSAAIATACKPEEQKRFTVTPGTPTGKPGQQQPDARHVHALLRLRHRAADDHIGDARRIERRRLRQHALQHMRQQIVRDGCCGTCRAAPCRPACALLRRCRLPVLVCSYTPPVNGFAHGLSPVRQHRSRIMNLR